LTEDGAVKLPNAVHAFVDVAKLRDYCLNPNHPRGRHKARVFLAALGLTAAHAGDLRDALLAAAQTEDATLGDRDEYGKRYVLDFLMMDPARQAHVRSVWIVRVGEDGPRLSTCYVL
jgi:hypothetical protein